MHAGKEKGLPYYAADPFLFRYAFFTPPYTTRLHPQ